MYFLYHCHPPVLWWMIAVLDQDDLAWKQIQLSRGPFAFAGDCQDSLWTTFSKNVVWFVASPATYSDDLMDGSDRLGLVKLVRCAVTRSSLDWDKWGYLDHCTKLLRGQEYRHFSSWVRRVLNSSTVNAAALFKWYFKERMLAFWSPPASGECEGIKSHVNAYEFADSTGIARCACGAERFLSS